MVSIASTERSEVRVSHRAAPLLKFDVNTSHIFSGLLRALRQYLGHSCLTCDGRPHGHGHGHQAQQEADGLGHVFGPNQLKGDRGHDANKAAVKQPHQQAHGDQPAEDVAQRDHHGHEADDEEGSDLERQERGAYSYGNCPSNSYSFI